MTYAPLPERRVGSVALVGAGPGDPELLTLKAVRLLEHADVVLFDDLVAPAVLEFTRRTARRLHVGKRGYRPSCRQEFIQRLMIRYARRGLAVVRLKAGDPLVFGRAGEEIAALRAAGIAVEIVPGVTSALALGAMTQCSLTLRGRAQSVELVTAQNHDGQLSPALAERALHTAARTLVIYMGAARALDIERVLLSAGHAACTPAVAVAGLSWPAQHLWHGCLDRLAVGVATLDRALPIIIGIGVVFADATTSDIRHVTQEMIVASMAAR